MRKTTSTVLVGLLGAGSAVALSIALPGVASANSCDPTTVTTQTQFDELFGASKTNDTRSHGHNVLEDDYLHVYTDGGAGVQEAKPGSTTGETQNADKVTGYYDIAAPYVPLAGQTAQENYKLDYNTLSGSIPPGYQLVVDLDGSGVQDGILVSEPVYGGGSQWWLTNGSSDADKAGAPHTGGGYGSPYYGTLDEWSQKFPAAKITAFGYSLGSGVQGDYALRSIRFGCNTFVFDEANTAPVGSFTTKQDGPADATVEFTSTSTDAEGDALTYRWNFGDGQFSNEANPTHTFAPGSYQVDLIVTDSKGASSAPVGTKVTVVATNTMGGAPLPNTGANVMGLAALGAVVIGGSGAGLLATRRRAAKHSA